VGAAMVVENSNYIDIIPSEESAYLANIGEDGAETLPHTIGAPGPWLYACGTLGAPTLPLDPSGLQSSRSIFSSIL
jgi:hypothetical protein